MRLTLNHTYRIYPDVQQQAKLLKWLKSCRGTCNYALRAIKDWGNSRQCSIDYCSLESEYIIPADALFPGYHCQQNTLPKTKKQFAKLAEELALVLQTTIRCFHDAWEYHQKQGFGFPRFKKYGQLKSRLFPQFETNPIAGWLVA